MRFCSAQTVTVCAGRVCLLLLLPGCRPGSLPSVEGTYSTVSESEWNIFLNLKQGGVAEILEESWAPGEYENRSTGKTEARWRRDGGTIILEYNGIADRLSYDPALSVAVLGYKGGAPGLVQITAFDGNSVLRDYPLWKLPHRFGQIPDPR